VNLTRQPLQEACHGKMIWRWERRLGCEPFSERRGPREMTFLNVHICVVPRSDTRALRPRTKVRLQGESMPPSLTDPSCFANPAFVSHSRAPHSQNPGVRRCQRNILRILLILSKTFVSLATFCKPVFLVSFVFSHIKISAPSVTSCSKPILRSFAPFRVHWRPFAVEESQYRLSTIIGN
jgi:hypothetical protein